MRPTRREDARGPAVDVVIASTRWNKTPHAAKLVRRTIAAAAPVRTRNAELSVVLTSNRTTAALNRQWRGQDKPTNVLSFPAPKRAHARAATRGAPRHLGDIVIAYETTAAKRGRSASRSIITWPIWRCMVFCIFWATITNRDAQAQAMERRERKILARLGVPDPYAARDADD